MKYRSLSIICLFCIISANVLGNTNNRPISSAGASAVSAYASMLNNAPTMLGQHYLAGASGTLGNIGETLAAQNVLATQLRNSGNWIALSPRVGRQGLDHIFIKTDSNGNPRGLIVGESKYGNSQLGMTKDGIQMGSRWTSKRLIAMGNRYTKLSSVTKIEKAPWIGSHQEMKVVLKSGKEVAFWRQGTHDSWKFSGTEQELAEAQKQAFVYGEYLKAAGEGTITYRSRIFQIKQNGDDIIITIKDASNVDTLKTIAKLPEGQKIVLTNAMNQKIDPQTIAAELKKKLPHLSDDEIKAMAEKLSSNVKGLTIPLSKWQITGKLAATAGIASGISIAMDVVMQWIGEEKVDLGRTAITGGAVFAGTMAGQALNLGLNHWRWSQHMLKALSGKLGCSASMLGSAASSAVGGSVVSALIAYGMYFAGYSDLETANVSVVAGSVASLVAVATNVGMFSLAASVGTASTGTAISALSGAAAKSAAFAWFAGGAKAAGGLGAAVGGCVVGGVVIVAGLAANYAVIATYEAVVEAKDRERIQILLHKLLNAPEEDWKQMLRNYGQLPIVI